MASRMIVDTKTGGSLEREGARRRRGVNSRDVEGCGRSYSAFDVFWCRRLIATPKMLGFGWRVLEHCWRCCGERIFPSLGFSQTPFFLLPCLRRERGSMRRPASRDICLANGNALEKERRLLIGCEVAAGERDAFVID